METFWDIVWLILAILFIVVGLIRLILHFVRPVTWRDGEGPAINEEPRGGFSSVLGPFQNFGGGWFPNFLADLLSTILFWRHR